MRFPYRQDNGGRPYYILLDEVQMLNEFEDVLNGLLHIPNADVYNLNMVIALSYQIDTGHSAVFRKWLINKVARKQEYNILLYLNGTSHTLYC